MYDQSVRRNKFFIPNLIKSFELSFFHLIMSLVTRKPGLKFIGSTWVEIIFMVAKCKHASLVSILRFKQPIIVQKRLSLLPCQNIDLRAAFDLEYKANIFIICFTLISGLNVWYNVHLWVKHLLQCLVLHSWHYCIEYILWTENKSINCEYILNI